MVIHRISAYGREHMYACALPGLPIPIHQAISPPDPPLAPTGYSPLDDPFVQPSACVHGTCTSPSQQMPHAHRLMLTTLALIVSMLNSHLTRYLHPCTPYRHVCISMPHANPDHVSSSAHARCSTPHQHLHTTSHSCPSLTLSFASVSAPSFSSALTTCTDPHVHHHVYSQQPLPYTLGRHSLTLIHAIGLIPHPHHTCALIPESNAELKP